MGLGYQYESGFGLSLGWVWFGIGASIGIIEARIKASQSQQGEGVYFGPVYELV